MAYTIVTKYHGPTDHKGARISARSGWNNRLLVTIPYPHELSGPEAHASAARAGLAKLEAEDRAQFGGSERPMVRGELAKGFVFLALSSGDIAGLKGPAACGESAWHDPSGCHYCVTALNHKGGAS